MENRVWRPLKHKMDVQKSGYLLKQGELLRQWQQRYFVLTRESLCYYLTEDEASTEAPKELIFFNDLSLYIDNVNEKQPRYCLRIVRRSNTASGTPRTLTLCSFSQKERNAWHTQILLAKSIALVRDRSWMGTKCRERKKSFPLGSLSPVVTAKVMLQKCKRRLSVGGTIRPMSMFDELSSPPRSPLAKISPSFQWKTTSWSTLMDHGLAI